MKFYKTDRWCSYYDKPSFSDEEWEKWANAYAEYIKTVNDKLPKGFVRLYYLKHGFHDFIISSICIQNQRPNKINVEIELDADYSELDNANEKYLLTYRNVSHYSINVPEDKQWFFHNMQWLADEFYLHEDGMWSHRIMCDGNCEIKVHFKQISIKKL
jgi:hypothetical protein